MRNTVTVTGPDGRPMQIAGLPQFDLDLLSRAALEWRQVRGKPRLLLFTDAATRTAGFYDLEGGTWNLMFPLDPEHARPVLEFMARQFDLEAS